MKHTLHILLAISSTMFCVQAQGPGGGRRGQGAGAAGFQEAIHKLFENHKAIRRTVEFTDDGYKSRTVSDDPEIAKTIQQHVKQMQERLGAGMMVRRWDPAFAELVEHYQDIGHDFKEVEGGVEMIARGKTPEAVKVVQNHARIVSGFAEKGMGEMHATHPRALDAAKETAGRNNPGAAGPDCQHCDKDKDHAAKGCPACQKENRSRDGKPDAPAGKQPAPPRPDGASETRQNTPQ